MLLEVESCGKMLRSSESWNAEEDPEGILSG
jgi:hypothetical protein